MAQTKTADQATDKAAASGSDAKPQRKRITRRKAVEQHVRTYFEAMDRRDVEAMVAHWREDGVEDVVPVGVMRGRDEMRGFISDVRGHARARTTITRLIAGEQELRGRVAHRGHLRRRSVHGHRAHRQAHRDSRASTCSSSRTARS